MRYSRLSFALLASLFFVGCNLSDEGGGIQAECSANSDCPSGEECSDGVCVAEGDEDAGQSDGDASTPTDAGPTDAGDGDLGTADMGSDMETPLECPEGFIDFNLDASDGCETIEFPGWEIDTCKTCAGIPNAVAGCGDGSTCTIARCEEGFFDRDGDVENGCEATCAAGECWTLLNAEYRDFAWVEGLGTWIAAAESGLIGRELDQGWEFHSLRGPRDFTGPNVGDFEVVDDIVYALQAGNLVRSVDHGRSFGPLPNAPDGTVIDISLGPDGRYYIVAREDRCGPLACATDADCPQGTCSNAGVCGASACQADRDCPSLATCDAGVCVPRSTGCGPWCSSGACGATDTYRAWVTEDFATWVQLGPDLQGEEIRYVNGTPTGNAILSVAGSDSVILRDGAWQQIESRNCTIVEYIWLESGDAIVVGEDCAGTYIARDDKVNREDTFRSQTRGVLFHEGVVYIVGDRFVSISSDFGEDFREQTLSGLAVHVSVDDADNSIVIRGSRGEIWRSANQGTSWIEEREAILGFPALVESGLPLRLVGGSQGGGVITPAAGAIESEWVTISPLRVTRMKQDAGGAFGFVGPSQLFVGTDWQNLNQVNISGLRVPSSDFPSCRSSECRIATITNFLDATYDASGAFFVAAMAILEERPNSLIGWIPVGRIEVILRSNDGASWQGSEFRAGVPSDILAVPFGYVATNAFSTDGRSWTSNATAECGAGPFLATEVGAVAAFNGETVCSTNDGLNWDVVTSSFWGSPVPVRVGKVQVKNDVFFAVVSNGFGTFLNVSDDGMTWRPQGPRWPRQADLDINDTRDIVGSPTFSAAGQ